VDSLCAAVESAVSDTHSWDAQLFFKLSAGVLLADKSPNTFGLPLKEQDLFDVGSNPGVKGIKFYFDPTEFPFDGDFSTSAATWPNLARRLSRSAAENGYKLSQQGRQSRSHDKQLWCSRGVKAAPATSKSHGPSDYRPSFLKSDRRAGSRPDGRDPPRRRSSARPTCVAELCGARLFFGVDHAGFFLRGGAGVKAHTHHPKRHTDVVPVSSRMLSSSEKANIQTCVKAGLTPSRASEILRVSSNVLLSRSSALYVSESLEHGEHSPSGVPPTTKATATNKLFANLEKEGHDHIVLLSRGTSHSNPGVQTSNFLASPPPATLDDFASSLGLFQAHVAHSPTRM
jgi:hypothetical protein